MTRSLIQTGQDVLGQFIHDASGREEFPAGALQTVLLVPDR